MLLIAHSGVRKTLVERGCENGRVHGARRSPRSLYERRLSFESRDWDPVDIRSTRRVESVHLAGSERGESLRCGGTCATERDDACRCESRDVLRPGSRQPESCRCGSGTGVRAESCRCGSRKTLRVRPSPSASGSRRAPRAQRSAGCERALRYETCRCGLPPRRGLSNNGAVLAPPVLGGGSGALLHRFGTRGHGLLGGRRRRERRLRLAHVRRPRSHAPTVSTQAMSQSSPQRARVRRL
jgi:hypothetical protein